MLEKMVEKVVERKMLELVGDYFKGDGDVMLEKMVEEVVERKMLELVGDRDKVVGRAPLTDRSSRRLATTGTGDLVPAIYYGCMQTRFCVSQLI